jgi:hypothetical protein
VTSKKVHDVQLDRNMSAPSVAQVERARRLLESEGDSGTSSERCAAAAGRVYDKLNAQLAPILGHVGVQVLFVHSAKQAQSDRGVLAAVGAPDGSTKLRACLQALEPAVATETAAFLFGTFVELITTFIGERLTVQVLRGAWPTIEETPPRETNK